MKPQQQHVLNLLQDNPPPQALARLSDLSEEQWQEVVRAAEVLGVAPVLIRRIERRGVAVPASIRTALRGALEAHTARNLRLLGEFGILARALQKADIAFLPVKGVHLCATLYENIGERPILDIDLLVPLADIPRSLEVIEGTGYRSSRPYDLEMEVRNYHHVPAYVKPGAPPLEIHWTLLNPRFQSGLNWQELWERSMLQRLGGVDVRVLCPDDLLVYLCAHVAYQHIYIDSIRSLYDIKLLLQREGESLAWGAITARARTWGLANSLYLTLRLTDELLGCPLPEAVWQGLRPPEFSERLVEAAVRRLLEHSETSPVVSAVWSRRNLLQRIDGLWGRLLVPPEVLAGRYRLPPKSRRVYLYYVVRAWDLLSAHGRDLFELLLGRRSRRESALRESELIAYLRWWQ